MVANAQGQAAPAEARSVRTDARASWWPRIRRQARRNPTMVLGAALLLTLVLASLLAPLLAPADPLRTGFSTRVRPPAILGFESPFLLGSDNLGRDILSRLLYGGQKSLWIAAQAVVISALVGVALGLVSGYFGRWIDDVIQRVVDVQLSFPVIMLAIAVIAAVGTSERALVGVLALAGWVIYARTVRASVLSIRHQEYVQAARALGAGDARIILRHILPNVTAPIIVQASLSVSYAIIAEASLAFLGLGVQPPTPAWGSMLRLGYNYLELAPWISISPGAAICLTVLAFNFLGDAIRDAFDPRLRTRAEPL